MPSMITDKEMAAAATQLTTFRAGSATFQTELSETLEKYSMLIEDYKRLKSDYEEERDSRERYKQLARGSDRNPFVLVLVDGDGYVFDDDLVSAGAEGGEVAAHRLLQAVTDSIHNRPGLENCKIMVRIYCNLTGLSRALSRVKLAGAEKRSLAPFVANFNRSNELFDFVDAGELKENADYKIRAAFRLFESNASCKHIFFAGCHDVGYISELMPYVGNRESRDRITLVRGASFHHEFNKLGMRIEGFSNVFRPTPLDAHTMPGPKSLPMRSIEPTAAGANDSPTKNICRFYQQGKCSYGSGCRNLHISKDKANGNNLGHPPFGHPSDLKDWRQKGPSSQPFQLSDISRSDNDFFMSNNRGPGENRSPSADDFSALPREEDIPAGHIPVNKTQHRLDPKMGPVSQEEWTAFNARASHHKLCNNYHLKGICDNGSNCQYDHSPITPTIAKCLQQTVRMMGCGRRGGCRVNDCIQGHVCQKPDCKQRGGKVFCKIPYTAHAQDLRVANYVPGMGGQQMSVVDENELHTITSGKGSPSSSSPGAQNGWTRASFPEAHNGWRRADSDDGKEDEAEGAPLDVADADSVD